MSDSNRPLVSDDEILPELTLKTILLGIVLSIVLAGANAYLGLFAGMTVSASIPAAVVSLAVLRVFRRSNILENNLVQTAASAGEALAAGVIFTLPALLIMGHWNRFPYWEGTMIAALGGMIGVLFSVPLRRALVVEQSLAFPEGVATAEVLKSGGIRRGEEDHASTEVDEAHRPTQGARGLIVGSVVGGIMKIAESGLGLWGSARSFAMTAGNRLWYGGVSLSPALLAVGYIVKLRIASMVFAGGVLAWGVGLPIYSSLRGIPEGPPRQAAMQIWSNQLRFMGVGAMVVGGLGALVQMAGPIVRSLGSGITSYRRLLEHGGHERRRTERDVPVSWVLFGLGLCLIPLGALYYWILGTVSVALILSVVMMIAGFLFAGVAGYMAGIVGSSNNPVSGVTIATLLFTALLLVVLLGSDHTAGPVAALFVGAVVACASAISGDTMQDLKAGKMVGATPWKQQVMEVVGVASSALIIMPVLFLLQARYGIGAVTPQHPNPLPAPQASLMASVTTGVFRGGLPWDMVWIGLFLAAALLGVDIVARRMEWRFRVPVLAVAVGIYLPLELSTTIFLGGICSWIVERWFDSNDTSGLLLASGFITGEALAGILLALPILFVSGGGAGWRFDVPPTGGPLLGLICFLAVGAGLLWYPSWSTRPSS